MAFGEKPISKLKADAIPSGGTEVYTTRGCGGHRDANTNAFMKVTKWCAPGRNKTLFTSEHSKAFRNARLTTIELSSCHDDEHAMLTPVGLCYKPIASHSSKGWVEKLGFRGTDMSITTNDFAADPYQFRWTEWSGMLANEIAAKMTLYEKTSSACAESAKLHISSGTYNIWSKTHPSKQLYAIAVPATKSGAAATSNPADHHRFVIRDWAPQFFAAVSRLFN